MASRTWLSVLALFLVALRVSEGREYTVGGGKDGAWTVPSNSSSGILKQWAESSRFQIGDHLVFKYNKDNDSVLQVTENDYNTCITSSPIASYNDGNSVVKLEKSGPHYFISGEKDACEKGEKVIVVVLSPRAPIAGDGPAFSPSGDGPALSPSSPAVPPSSSAPPQALMVVFNAGFALVLAGLMMVLF
ncbi:early nodulin-like protein 1 [Amborella trichopoda]|uniref:Phytocyanin domain-containing protein n=1 Tax=Amborella trichopoda TaxID=13333 RepID=W1PH65_AMBTC|nr:early nodulin-like protein 1 [Amborella trichopoda]ERN07039.1 hypothetical protein AMTR_s00019p00028610 [Amborella trichopoda]|eukprot:XP_006845364.1 early nodulin-like protein 1 [Amborella trichopoda]